MSGPSRGPATPSSACKPCREKRRRCDKKLPVCTQCIRAKVECGGYRDRFSLRLRDQTAAVVTKFQGNKAADHAASSPNDSTTLVEPDSLSVTPYNKAGQATVPPVSPSHNLPTNFQDAAIAYFLHVYAPSSKFNYLPYHIYQAHYPVPQEVLTALSAPALVLFSQDFRLPNLLPQARVLYTKSLAQTNKSLTSTRHAALDSTLISVLLLSLFESLSMRGSRSPASWMAHAEGAAALLRVRGKSQFNTTLGRDLFLHASGQLRVSYVARGASLPPALKTLQQSCATLFQDHFGSRLAGLQDEHAFLLESLGASSKPPEASEERSGDHARLLANVLRDTPPLTVCECLAKALALSEKVEGLQAELEISAPYEIVKKEKLGENADLYGESAYRYHGVSDPMRWNALRVLRLRLNDLLFNMLSTDDEAITVHFSRDYLAQQRAVAFDRTQNTVHDLLSSVPFLLDLSPTRVLSSTARRLIWPLSIVASSAVAPASAREFALRRLAFIGREFNLAQASETLRMVEAKDDEDDWLVTFPLLSIY
ncbi:hypothetical protein F5Y18DRAFT_211356 [Xylariaceae sp. FL1019]|nr:hypothetical protein F5Y18DRAFT_211356 [Xylariaceae sp. FL1019]